MPGIQLPSSNELPPPPSYELVIDEEEDHTFDVHTDSESEREDEQVPFLANSSGVVATQNSGVTQPLSSISSSSRRRLPTLPNWMLQHHDFSSPRNGRPSSSSSSPSSRPSTPLTPRNNRSRQSTATGPNLSSDNLSNNNTHPNEIDDAEESSALRQEMEYFEIIDPDNSNNTPTIYSRASEVSKRFAQKLSSTFIAPVQHMIVDPVARVWQDANSRIDARLSRFGNPLMFRRLFYLLLVGFTIFIAVALGLVPGNGGFGRGDVLFGDRFHDHAQLHAYLKDAISADSIKSTMEYMTSMSHMAGTSGDYILAKYVQDMFMSYGINPVEFNPEHVYLTSPNSTESAMELKLLADNDDNIILFEADLWEGQAIRNPTESQTQPRPFHALSASGNATGHVIYANYGTKEDFQFLKEKNIPIEGSIVFMKYGKMALGLKILLAEKEGALAVVTFSERASSDIKKGPDGPDYPDDAAQRGDASIAAIYPGDILTPGWSSTNSPQAINFKEAHNIPHIPSIPVSWQNVKPFLAALKGHGEKIVDDNWKNNGSPDIEEWWTGTLSSPRAFLRNEPILGERHEIWNVLGRIEGMEQYDKAIIIGAQRDSFCYGAVDPMSGTAIMLEVARMFALLNSQLGWIPLRPIYFASWDATEQNIAGSTEWAEYHEQELRDDGLIYINLDSAVSGTKFTARGHPMFDGVINSILEDVIDPITNSSSLADSWGSDTHIGTLKEIGDYLPFLSHTGIPSINVKFENGDDNVFPRHSCFDTIEWIEKYADPDFAYHKTLAEIVAFLLLRFSDAPVVPFNIGAYGERLHYYTRDLQRYAKSLYPADSNNVEAMEQELDFNKLIYAADHMIQIAVTFNEWFQDWLSMAPMGETAMMSGHRWNWNTRMLNIDKHLLERNGLPNRNWFKHVIFGPQLWHPTSGDYEWSTFPGIRDAIEAQDWKLAALEIEHVSQMINDACEQFLH